MVNHTRGRPHLRGPRPHTWKTGPDETRHAQYMAYLKQKAQANFRNEVWAISFEDWVSAWGDKWAQRGMQRDNYCMSRHDRSQGWHFDNVKVCTRQEFFDDNGAARRIARIKYKMKSAEYA